MVGQSPYVPSATIVPTNVNNEHTRNEKENGHTPGKTIGREIGVHDVEGNIPRFSRNDAEQSQQ